MPFRFRESRSRSPRPHPRHVHVPAESHVEVLMASGSRTIKPSQVFQCSIPFGPKKGRAFFGPNVISHVHDDDEEDWGYEDNQNIVDGDVTSPEAGEEAEEEQKASSRGWGPPGPEEA